MKERKDYGRGSGRRFRVLLAGFFVLFLALLPLGAWPMWQAEKEEEPIVIEAPIAMTEAPTAEEQSQSELSGTTLNGTSTEPSPSLEKAESGRRLNGEEALELYLTLVEARNEAETARIASEAKDGEIADLKARLSTAEAETGTKAYVMVEGIVGFENLIPQFGAGLTIGTRIGNSLLAELGIDYEIGGVNGYNQFSVDNFQFRYGIGWMF